MPAVKRAASAAGLTCPLGAEVTDAVLEQRLFARVGVKQRMRRLPEPDWRNHSAWAAV